MANTDVNGAGTGAAGGSSTSENPSGNDPNVGGQPLNDGSETGQHEEAVPYDRFKTQLDGKKAAEGQVQALQEQLNQTQQAYRTLAHQAVQTVATPRAPEAPATPVADPDEEMVRQMLGNDETGQKAYEIIDRLSKKRAADAIVAERQNTYNMINQVADQKIGGVTASMETRNTLSAWKGSGLITADDERRISDVMDAEIARTPGWANQQNLLLKSVYGDLASKGEITGRKPATGPPVGGGGGGGGGPAAKPEDALAADIHSRFNSLRGKSLGDVRKNVGEDLFRVSDDTESEILRGSYRMGK